MKKAFIFHGTGLSPRDHWFPWLKEKLESKGLKVAVPEFPTPENQNLDAWKQVLEKQEIQVDEDTVLIGHSTGAVFILDILNDKEIQVEASFLVSGFVGPLNDERFDPLNESFAEREFDFEKIRSSSQKIHQFHSASDPYVPMEKAEELAEKIRPNLHLISDADHFNTESGYTEFPELLKQIQKLL